MAESELQKAARRVIEVVDEPSPQDDGTPEVEARWYYEWEVRHRTAVNALRKALDAEPESIDGEVANADYSPVGGEMLIVFDESADFGEAGEGSVYDWQGRKVRITEVTE